jgi:DNA-binding HxlR family transcriptional regulator
VDSETAFERIAQLFGCKWSIAILSALREGASRPAELLRKEEGLSAKVLHRCLNRMERDGLLHKEVLPEVPPHTEYALTDMGYQFLALMDSVRDFAKTWKGTQPPVRV